MPNSLAKTFFFGRRHSIDCKMPNFQAEIFVFGPLEWFVGPLKPCWAWYGPQDENVADLCLYFWGHVDGSPAYEAAACYLPQKNSSIFRFFFN